MYVMFLESRLKRCAVNHRRCLGKPAQDGETLIWALKDELEFPEKKKPKCLSAEGAACESLGKERFGGNANYSAGVNSRGKSLLWLDSCLQFIPGDTLECLLSLAFWRVKQTEIQSSFPRHYAVGYVVSRGFINHTTEALTAYWDKGEAFCFCLLVLRWGGGSGKKSSEWLIPERSGHDSGPPRARAHLGSHPHTTQDC